MTTGPLHIGHSVRLLDTRELAVALQMSPEELDRLLTRLKVPQGRDYGPVPVINMAAFEAAVFADLSPEMSPDIVRLYQTIASLDHSVLDKGALQKRLAAYLRYMTRSSKGGRVKG